MQTKTICPFSKEGWLKSAVAYGYEEASEPIEAERAMALWRRVLAQLITDYLEGYEGADKEVMGPCLDNLCEIVGFDTDSTRKTIIQAKQEFQASGQNLRAWIEKRYNKNVRRKVALRRRHTTNNIGGLLKLLSHKRLERVCPKMAERIHRDKQNRSGLAAKQKRAYESKEAQERRRVREFYQEFWGKSVRDESHRLEGGA